MRLYMYIDMWRDEHKYIHAYRIPILIRRDGCRKKHNRWKKKKTDQLLLCFYNPTRLGTDAIYPSREEEGGRKEASCDRLDVDWMDQVFTYFDFIATLICLFSQKKKKNLLYKNNFIFSIARRYFSFFCSFFCLFIIRQNFSFALVLSSFFTPARAHFFTLTHSHSVSQSRSLALSLSLLSLFLSLYIMMYS